METTDKRNTDHPVQPEQREVRVTLPEPPVERDVQRIYTSKTLHHDGTVYEGTVTIGPAPPELVKMEDWFSSSELTDAHYEIARKKREEASHNLPFPESALQGLLGQWSLFMARDSICAPEHYYLSALTYLGHALGEVTHLDFGQGRMVVRPQLYSLLVGPPGDGKGTVLQNTNRFFAALGKSTNGESLTVLKACRE